eukprot:TRINITY_DN4611_c0_g1_i1.p1 TRINITY_DN4611_c0_g1~~TRINITY_DN4611_c0_g1_i1.p1  ORF type:complete len:178 (-),score=31.71 TRINITY_DN4611_c0_g1_i1:596-1105(-)
MSYEYISDQFKNRETEDVLTQMLGGNPSTRTTHSQQHQTGASTAGMPKLNDPAAFEAVLKEFGTESSKVQWVLIDYTDANTIGITKKGAGLGVPPQPVQNDINDSKVQYLLCQMMQGVKQYALFTWIGSKAPADRVKASETHKTALHRHLAELFMKLTKNQLQSGELRG